jgi:hypothetical protein
LDEEQEEKERSGATETSQRDGKERVTSQSRQYTISSRRKTDHIREINLGRDTFKKVGNMKFLGVNGMKETNEAPKLKSEYRQQTVPTGSTGDT